MAVFTMMFGGQDISDRSWTFVCFRRSFSCKTLGGPQFDSRPIEAVEGANNAKSGNVGKIRACYNLQKWHEKIG